MNAAAFALVAIMATFAGAQGFTRVGDLGQPMLGHSATRLNDGRVLAVSANGHSELFEPTTNQWQSTVGAMAVGSEKHTSTLLSDGSVLVVGGHLVGVDRDPTGGQVVTGVTGRTELFDQLSGTWQTVGELASPRSHHVTIRTNDGSVLAIGGANWSGTGWVAIASIDRYDPVIRTWQSVGALPEARFGHTATLLTDGSILILGGALSNNNPSGPPALGNTNCWKLAPLTLAVSTCGSIPGLGRSRHTATKREDGKVFVAGGTAVYESDLVFDAAEDTWTGSGLRISPRMNYTVSPFKGDSMLVIGGSGDYVAVPTGSAPPSNFDQSYRLFESTDRMIPSAVQFSGHAATVLLDGRILVTGGATAWQSYPVAGGSYYRPAPGNRSYVTDRTSVDLFFGALGGLPYSPVVGERYWANVGAAPTSGQGPLPNLVVLSDGTASCSFQPPMQGCQLTTLIQDGTKTYTLSYPGDEEHQPTTRTWTRPAGGRLHVEVYGGGYPAVGWDSPIGLSFGCHRTFGPFASNCDPALAPGVAVSLTPYNGVIAPDGTPGSVFVGWQGVCAGTAPTCMFTMPSSGTPIVKAYFAPASAFPLRLDLNGTGTSAATSDGLLILRALSHKHDGALVSATAANSPNADMVYDRVNWMRPLLDVDRDGRADVETDGVIIIRYLLGIRGSALIAGALGQGALRTDPQEIGAALAALMP